MAVVVGATRISFVSSPDKLVTTTFVLLLAAMVPEEVLSNESALLEIFFVLLELAFLEGVFISLELEGVSWLTTEEALGVVLVLRVGLEVLDFLLFFTGSKEFSSSLPSLLLMDSSSL